MADIEEKNFEFLIFISGISIFLGVILLFKHLIFAVVVIIIGIISYTQLIKKYPDAYFNYLEKYSPKTGKPQNLSNVSEKKDECINSSIYRKNHQEQYLNKLKFEYTENSGIEVDFVGLKHSIYSDDDDYDIHNEYRNDEHQGYREYFYFNGAWCYFDYDDDYDCEEYEFKMVKNKIFDKECYIDKIGRKTKKLINFYKKQNKLKFTEKEFKGK